MWDDCGFNKTFFSLIYIFGRNIAKQYSGVNADEVLLLVENKNKKLIHDRTKVFVINSMVNYSSITDFVFDDDRHCAMVMVQPMTCVN